MRKMLKRSAFYKFSRILRKELTKGTTGKVKDADREQEQRI